MHPNMSSEFISYFKDKPLYYEGITRNPKFKLSWVTDNMDCDWNWDVISEHVTIKDVLKHPEYPWNFMNLTISNMITTTDMVNNPTLPWRHDQLGFQYIQLQELHYLRTFHNYITRTDMIDHTRMATWEIMKRNLDIPWVGSRIRFVEGSIEDDDDINAIRYIHSESELDFSEISKIANLKLIFKNDDLPWVWENVALREDFTYQHVNMCCAELKKLILHKTPLEDDSVMIRQWTASKTIQRYWKRCISDPDYQMCKNRLTREFNSMII
jgi:hypothetical protein